ncbi:MAG: hypothetical protein QXT14_08885 [Candidatus Bathyarchaeia archaeon]
MDQKSRKKDDPVLYEDFVEFVTNIESRLSKLETEQDWVKKSIDELKSSIEKYKWWIVGSFFGSSLLFFILTRIVGG